jgi:hypothetical protein
VDCHFPSSSPRSVSGFQEEPRTRTQASPTVKHSQFGSNKNQQKRRNLSPLGAKQRRWVLKTANPWTDQGRATTHNANLWYVHLSALHGLPPCRPVSLRPPRVLPWCRRNGFLYEPSRGGRDSGGRPRRLSRGWTKGERDAHVDCVASSRKTRTTMSSFKKEHPFGASCI